MQAFEIIQAFEIGLHSELTLAINDDQDAIMPTFTHFEPGETH